MRIARLLIANRGEIAVRVARAAGELGVATVGVFAEDDASCLHVERVDDARPLRGAGPRAYLDVSQIIAAAGEAKCDAIHPGYGFASESESFARACAQAGLTFVGPAPETLALLGDKAAARALAERCGVPVARGTHGATTLEQARAFLASLPRGSAVMVKAIAGGGGRGMRPVRDDGELADAWARCRSEAQAAFGNGDLYVEELLERVRHVEVQVVGDDGGEVSALGERDCSLQRRRQKLVEIAPAPHLSAAVRERLAESAVRMARALRFRNAGTFEFLVDTDDPSRFVFLEANPRLQVEHTVTEEVSGIDLVVTQLRIAAGASLTELGLRQHEVPAPRGFALQARVNLETLLADGTLKPASGTLEAFEPPAGPGVRVDACAYAGYTPSRSFDSLLAKVVVKAASSDFGVVVRKARRALEELRVEGIATNAALLSAVLAHPAVADYRVTTSFVDDNVRDLVAAATAYGEPHAAPPPAVAGTSARAHRAAAGLAGAKVDARDPLAVLVHGKTAMPGAAGVTAAQERPATRTAARNHVHGAAREHVNDDMDPNAIAVRAPMQGTIVALDVAAGDSVPAGAQVAVLESMKMEHVVAAPAPGVVRAVHVCPGDTIYEGAVLVVLDAGEVEPDAAAAAEPIDLECVRGDLAEVHARHRKTLDEARPDAVARRRATGQRTARENVEDLCDPGTFVEYGPLMIAAQRRRRSVDELIERTPADGLIGGIGRVNGDLFDEARSRCMVLAYDYTVLAGTQGLQNHRKKDRMFELAAQMKLPVVLFTEGGGGRPGDTDSSSFAGLDCWAFNYWGRLSGLVPLVGINSGRCFAGNAALLGCCDVVIATANSSIGMGGPAMIEGGGLGVFHPDEVGPMHVQVPGGVVDVAVDDEAEAVRAAKRYLSYFQGPIAPGEHADQRALRAIVPENRLRIYDVRAVIGTLADTGSVLELRRHFGLGMVTALARIEGRPLGIVANDPSHLAGAIDRDGADKAARFLQLCDAFDLPVLLLCDTPGMMVGPEAEKTALVRHVSRLFVVGASLTVPFFTIVLRKGYGLGAQAMAGGSFKAPIFTVAWPTAEFGGMGLEGAVKLGYRKELAAVSEPAARKVLFDEMVARMYEQGKAVNYATYFEIDDVIDPADSRKWILNALRSAPPPPVRAGKKRPCIDTW